jgi:hypothetical protein
MTSDARETDKPNEFGFSGGATAPEPEPETRPVEEVDGESIAVPGGDLTGAISNAIDEATEGRHRKDDR